MSDVKLTASGNKIVKALEALVSEGMRVKIEVRADRRADMDFPVRYVIAGEWNRETIEAPFNGTRFNPVRGDGPETLAEVHAMIAEWSSRWADVVREGDCAEIERLGVDGFTPPAEDGPSVADMIMSDPDAVVITMDGSGDVVTVGAVAAESAPAGTVTAVVADAPAPVVESAPADVDRAEYRRLVRLAEIGEALRPAVPVKITEKQFETLIIAADGRLRIHGAGYSAIIGGGNGAAETRHLATVAPLVKSGHLVRVEDAGNQYSGSVVLSDALSALAAPVITRWAEGRENDAPADAPVVSAGTDDVAPVLPAVADDVAPVAPDAVPAESEGDPVADMVADHVLMVGTVLNRWSAVAEGAFKLSAPVRTARAAELMRDFAELKAVQADADGKGSHASKISPELNKIIHAGRTLLRHWHAVIIASDMYAADRMPATQKRPTRKVVKECRRLAAQHAATRAPGSVSGR